ncbi:EmrB/QacA subfamily drug resistance transporter [Actinomadura pelletieri DSM 43383]|uniref:EmrB/QacA subfamily drug resistance transporter n=1 Tax=Actinomadura pelletieri DSM 43383 TaxID=1120940 RepID=A0A495QU69_9ACTN|nr:MFS transporter [Actinomadura pelletieri]RKS77056.1 EmrB/QacA subfamily drug resistance transporter [Actinomadura pelletieri DSM 43383]
MVASTDSAKSGPGQRIALLALAQFVITLDFNIVFVALPDIGRELNFDAHNLQWVVNAYVVALGGLLLFGGRAADRLGARRMFIVGLLVYAVSSLVGGLAGGTGVLVAARAAQGLGGALLTPATLRLIFIGFDEGPMRNRALVVYGSIGGAGLSAGALLGGVLTDYAGWEWIFFVNIPLAVAGALLAPAVLPASPPLGAGRDFDVVGALLATAGATLIVFGLASGPDVGWGTPEGAGAVAAGLALLAAFLIVEGRSRDALMPLRLLKHRSLAVTMGAAFFYQGSLVGVYYLFTTYLQDVLNYSPMSAGLAFLPPTIISMVFALKFSTVIMNKRGLRTTMFLGVLVTGIGAAILATAFVADGSYWLLLPGLAVWSIGGALAIPAVLAGAGAGVSPLEQGVSAAMAMTTRQVGGAVGLAALIAVVTDGLHAGPDGRLPTADVLDGLRAAGWVAGGAVAAAAFLCLLLKKPEPAPAPVQKSAEPSDAAAPPGRRPPRRGRDPWTTGSVVPGRSRWSRSRSGARRGHRGELLDAADAEFAAVAVRVEAAERRRGSWPRPRGRRAVDP